MIYLEIEKLLYLNIQIFNSIRVFADKNRKATFSNFSNRVSLTKRQTDGQKHNF